MLVLCFWQLFPEAAWTAAMALYPPNIWVINWLRQCTPREGGGWGAYKMAPHLTEATLFVKRRLGDISSDKMTLWLKREGCISQKGETWDGAFAKNEIKMWRLVHLSIHFRRAPKIRWQQWRGSMADRSGPGWCEPKKPIGPSSARRVRAACAVAVACHMCAPGWQDHGDSVSSQTADFRLE